MISKLQILGERYNDGLILDCCKYFGRGRNTVLCSADNNLCLESEAAGERRIPSKGCAVTQPGPRCSYGNSWLSMEQSRLGKMSIW